MRPGEWGVIIFSDFYPHIYFLRLTKGKKTDIFL